MAPKYGEDAIFQVVSGELRVDLPASGAYVFEIDTPNLEKDRKGFVYKQRTN